MGQVSWNCPNEIKEERKKEKKEGKKARKQEKEGGRQEERKKARNEITSNRWDSVRQFQVIINCIAHQHSVWILFNNYVTNQQCKKSTIYQLEVSN